MNTSKSEKLFSEAKRHLVGGVNSPVRAFGAVGGTPRFMSKAKGATITDVDGHTYIDFVGSWGPMILGHMATPVVDAVKKQFANGYSFGASTAVEAELAALIKEAFPSIDLLRFTSSGTEATMTAIRLARGFTKRERILKFEGTYHGHSDALLVAAGSGATTFGVPSSAGVPSALAKNTWILPYNDSTGVETLFRTQGVNIAAVIVEPVCGNMGVVEPAPEFLKTLRDQCDKYGALLIFDEVMTGFRLAWGGAQEMYKIEPDLTCLGKIIGGGFPVGAVGGTRNIMERLAPLGDVYQAGTLSGNPVAMAAGLATLKVLKAKKPYKDLDVTTKDFAEFIRREADRRKILVRVNQKGSMFTIFFNDQGVTDYFTATQSDKKKYATFFHAALECGLSFPPSQFEAAFLSMAHVPAVMAKAKKQIQAALDKMRP